MAYAQGAAIAPLTPQPIREERNRTSRTLVWHFERNGELLTCALALTGDCAAYELRILPRPTLGFSSELFGNAIAAFRRQAAFERALLSEGWVMQSLEQVLRVSRSVEQIQTVS
jgi:hypothetical protein